MVSHEELQNVIQNTIKSIPANFIQHHKPTNDHDTYDLLLTMSQQNWELLREIANQLLGGDVSQMWNFSTTLPRTPIPQQLLQIVVKTNTPKSMAQLLRTGKHPTLQKGLQELIEVALKSVLQLGRVPSEKHPLEGIIKDERLIQHLSKLNQAKLIS